MKTIYVAGNPLVEEDSLPLRIMPGLRERFPRLEFRELEPTEDLPEEKDLIIIDIVKGIEKVQVIDDIEKIITRKAYSLHDFDLGASLKLMRKAGRLEKVVIIGVPMGIGEREALRQVSGALIKIAASQPDTLNIKANCAKTSQKEGVSPGSA